MTFALFLLYVVLSYVHPGEIVPALAPYRVTFFVGLAGLAVAFATLPAKGSALVSSLQLRLLIVLVAVMGLSLMVAERWLGAPIVTLQRFGPSLTMFVLAAASVTTIERLRIAAACVIGLTLTLMVQGAAAYHLGYNARIFLLDPATRGESVAAAAIDDETLDAQSSDRNADEVDAADEEGQELPRIRGLGFMHDPNDLALGMIVALGLVAGAWKPKPQAGHVLLALTAAALAYGVYLTRSRGGVVALVVVLWRFAASRIGAVPALVLVAAIGAGAFALDFGGRPLSIQPDESASERIVAWTEGLEMLKAQPILGVGYGQFLDHHTLTAHNSLVLCLAETGLVGGFFWVGLLVVTAFELHGVRNLRGASSFDEAARQCAEGLQLSLVGYLAAAFFLSRTFVPILYLIVGLAAALAAIVRAANRSIPLPALPELGSAVLACELGGLAIVYVIVKLQVA